MFHQSKNITYVSSHWMSKYWNTFSFFFKLKCKRYRLWSMHLSKKCRCAFFNQPLQHIFPEFIRISKKCHLNCNIITYDYVKISWSDLKLRCMVRLNGSGTRGSNWWLNWMGVAQQRHRLHLPQLLLRAKVKGSRRSRRALACNPTACVVFRQGIPETPIFTETVVFRVSPWIMTPNTLQPEEVLVCRWDQRLHVTVAACRNGPQ